MLSTREGLLEAAQSEATRRWGPANSGLYEGLIAGFQLGALWASGGKPSSVASCDASASVDKPSSVAPCDADASGDKSSSTGEPGSVAVSELTEQALGLLDELNAESRIDYDSYVTLHDLFGELAALANAHRA